MAYTTEEAERAVRLVRLILCEPKMIAGLTMMEARICRVLQGADGRRVSPELLAEAVGSKSVAGVRVAISKLRAKRPDIGARIWSTGAPSLPGYWWNEEAPGSEGPPDASSAVGRSPRVAKHQD